MDTDIKELRVRFSRVFNRYYREKFKFGTEDQAEEFLKIPKTTFRQWMRGSSLPSLGLLIHLKNKLRTSLDDLLEEKTENIQDIAVWMLSLKARYQESEKSKRDIDGVLQHLWPNHENEVRQWLQTK